jgi:hypothetical protein
MVRTNGLVGTAAQQATGQYLKSTTKINIGGKIMKTFFSKDIFGGEQDSANRQHESEATPETGAQKETEHNHDTKHSCPYTQPRQNRTWREKWDSFRVYVTEAAPIIKKIAEAAWTVLGAFSAILSIKTKRKNLRTMPAR